ncbi:MAG: CAAX prenyl protease-related protein [Abditibacteriales bacterium]|nr:CAAX prenyl protease-related protein [Abditibacteriales bacterium]MDW8364636.1 CAAX prenyl protease-related protein [Abditibacteriales bacterium]
MKQRPAFPYVLPFAIYLAFLTVEWLWREGVYFLYPVKTVAVTVALLCGWRFYGDMVKPRLSLLAALVGVVVLIIWVSPLSEVTMGGKPKGFNPFRFDNDALVYFLIFFRLFGASVVVPFMEEIFWRGFLIRWIINPDDFEKVPIGQFTWTSFAVTTVLFGVEHHQWLVGIIAGAIYNGLLYRTKAVFPCILAHAVTNLGLGIYVLCTQKWYFW